MPVTRVVGSLAANEFEEVQREYYWALQGESNCRHVVTLPHTQKNFGDWPVACISECQRSPLGSTCLRPETARPIGTCT
jgi:hypothetical protein